MCLILLYDVCCTRLILAHDYWLEVSGCMSLNDDELTGLCGGEETAKGSRCG